MMMVVGLAVLVALCVVLGCLVFDVELAWAPEGAEGLVLRGAEVRATRLTLGERGARQGSGPVWPAPQRIAPEGRSGGLSTADRAENRRVDPHRRPPAGGQ